MWRALFPPLPVWPLLALLLPTLAGCAPDLSRVRVEAQAGEEGPTPCHYVIRHGQEDADPLAPEHHRQRRALARVLDAQGFTEVRDASDSDALVSLRFGLVGEETPHQGAALDHLFVLDVRAEDAQAPRAGRGARRLWQATATAHGHLDRREQVFRALLAALAPRLGSTGQWDVLILRDPVTGAFEARPAP